MSKLHIDTTSMPYRRGTFSERFEKNIAVFGIMLNGPTSTLSSYFRVPDFSASSVDAFCNDAPIGNLRIGSDAEYQQENHFKILHKFFRDDYQFTLKRASHAMEVAILNGDHRSVPTTDNRQLARDPLNVRKVKSYSNKPCVAKKDGDAHYLGTSLIQALFLL